MKQFFKFFFASLLALVLFVFLGIFILIGFGAASSSKKDTKPKSTSVLYLDLSTEIKEQSTVNSLSFLDNKEDAEGLNDIKKSIAAAKTDDRIKGIYLKLNSGANSWATLYDIKAALQDFKTSKKFIIAYGEAIDQKNLYIASVATKVYANPSGAVELKGLAATGTFYKKALDKLDVQPEIFFCGKFKGATEPFRFDKYSEPNKMQIKNLLNDFYTEFTTAISQKSGKDIATIQQLANDNKIQSPVDAVNNKIIDATKYESEVLNEIRKNIGIAENEKINFISTAKYADAVEPSKFNKTKIAVLYAQGEIVDGKGDGSNIASETFIKSIHEISNNDNIKAVVLRVNSPGGSALASEVIYHELMEMKKKKPLIVSMGDVAASGGYYISCAADSIFALPTTITGSIGVFGMMFNFNKFLENKLGVTFDVVKTAEHADMPTATRDLTDAEKLIIQNGVDSVYFKFKTRVSTARKIDMAFTDSIAQGHVYSGSYAKTIKLIDAMGSTERAVQSAATLAKLTDYKIIEYPEPEDKLNKILNRLNNKDDDVLVKQFLGNDYASYKKMKSIRANFNKMVCTLPYELDIK